MTGAERVEYRRAKVRQAASELTAALLETRSEIERRAIGEAIDDHAGALRLVVDVLPRGAVRLELVVFGTNGLPAVSTIGDD